MAEDIPYRSSVDELALTQPAVYFGEDQSGYVVVGSKQRELNFEDDKISEVAIDGQGCSISQSSASMMTEAIKGKTRAEIETLTRQFRDMMSLDGEAEIELDPDRPGAVLGEQAGRGQADAARARAS